jgi:acetyl-CoA carboxylase biotin carboxylase subunit
MKVARSAEELENAFRTARSEAKAAFGNDEVYIEKYLGTPAPYRGAGLRRRQGRRGASGRARLFAAAPPPEGAGRGPGPCIDAETRARIGETCAKAIGDLGYAARARSSSSTRTASSTSSR